MRAIFLYSMATGKSVQITDGMADAISPAFDASGKYLYFLASTNYGLKSGWLDMSSQEHYTRRNVYLMVLSKDEPSPFLPSLVDEPGRELASADSTPAKPARAPMPGRRAPAPRLDTATATRVDLEGIQQRIVPLAIPPGDYGNLLPGSTGTFFFTETPFPSRPAWRGVPPLAVPSRREAVAHVRGRNHRVRRVRRHQEDALRHARQSLEHRRHR